MTVSLSVFFIFFSSSCFPENASGPILFCCFSADSQHHMEPAESATKRRSSENALVRCFQLPLSNIRFLSGISIKKWKEKALVLMLNSNPALYVRPLLYREFRFDRTLFAEIVSKLSSNVTFSYSTNYMNEKCVLPMHQKFEAKEPSLSNVL